MAGEQIMPMTLDECKTKVTEAINKYQPQIAQHLGGSGPTFEVDWDSFEAANNPGRVFYHPSAQRGPGELVSVPRLWDGLAGAAVR